MDIDSRDEEQNAKRQGNTMESTHSNRKHRDTRTETKECKKGENTENSNKTKQTKQTSEEQGGLALARRRIGRTLKQRFKGLILPTFGVDRQGPKQLRLEIKLGLILSFQQYTLKLWPSRHRREKKIWLGLV